MTLGKSVRKAVIPAAGLGTRFLPATKATPKEMLPVVDKPAIQYVVEEAVSAGLDDVLMITGRNKRPLEDHFDRNYELESALQKKGDADRLAKVQEQHGGSVIALMEVAPEQIHLYGCAAVETTAEGDLVKVTGLVEKPDP